MGPSLYGPSLYGPIFRGRFGSIGTASAHSKSIIESIGTPRPIHESGLDEAVPIVIECEFVLSRDVPESLK